MATGHHILFKFAAQYIAMKTNEFVTNVGFASPTKKSRIWAVQPGTRVYPTTMVTQGQLATKSPVVTDSTWVFTEKLAHLMTPNFWVAHGLTDFVLPIYVQFSEPVQDDDGEMVFGLVAPGHSLMCM